jgi:hypothetical protein
MKTYRFSLILTSAQCLAYYAGHIRYVLVWADTGQKIQLHAEHFRPFITHAGVSGRFELITTAAGKFVQLKKIN